MLVYLTLIDSEDETSKFEIIYERYKDLMFYVADRVLNDAEDAEDAVHQSFLKIIGVLEKIEDPLCPKTRSLIVIITERTAIDLNRRLRRRTLLPMDGEPYGVSSGAGIEDIPIRMDVAAAIAALPARYREALLLKYDCGYSTAEIAQMLSMTEANARKTIQRAKAKLKQLLDEQEVTF